MPLVTRLEPAAVSVAPGAEAQVRLTVHNTGDIVEAYDLRVLGTLATTATVDPPLLNLYPGDEGSATVRFVVARDSTLAAGDIPFGIHVAPRERPEEAVVEEGTLTLQRFAATTAELTPRTSHGRLRARHTVAVDNRGNAPLLVTLTGLDPDQAVEILCAPPTLSIGAGQAAFSKVTVKPRQRFWRGVPRTRTFTVTAKPEQDAPVTVNGITVQDPILPAGLGRALLALLGLAAVLAVLWFTLLKPAVQSTAKDAAASVNGQAAASQAAQSAAAANSAASSAASQASAANAKADIAISVSGGATQPIFNRRLSVTVTPSADPNGTSQGFTVPAGRELRITDLVFDSQGNQGFLTLRNGNAILLTLQPQDFRTLDEHFVSPLLLKAGSTLTLRLTCSAPVNDNTTCNNGVLVTGTLGVPPSPSPSPSP
jgi:hypothetical protein